MDGTYAYDAFGNVISGTGAGGTGSPPTWQHLLYAGEYYNQDLGLYALGRRLYDPTVGRFTTADTYPGMLTDPSSENGYVYVEDNPILWVDPTGMHFCAGSIAQQARFGNINFCPVNGSPQELEGWALGVVGAGGLAVGGDALWTLLVGGGAYQEEIEEAENASEGAAEEYSQYATQATHYASSDTVVLGKLSDPGSPSYVSVAERMQATYFSMSNWDEVQTKIGEDNM